MKHGSTEASVSLFTSKNAGSCRFSASLVVYVSSKDIYTTDAVACVHVKLLKSLNDGKTVNQLQCQVIKDPEKTQDPAGIRTQDLLITQ